MKLRQHFGLQLILAMTCTVFGPLALHAAESYPTRPVRMVVPYAPGGNTDVLARLIAQRLTQNLGQQVVVDNRPGGNTLIGTELVARAPADGHTIMLTTLTFTVVPSLYRKLPFDAVKDFTPITLAVTLPNVLVTHPAIPARSLKELINYAKANPGKLSYASTGSGTSPHLSMDITSGKLRALAVTSGKRAAAAPTIPTVGETLPGYEMDPWFGVLGPAGMTPAVVKRLHGEIARILLAPEMKDHLNSLGAEPAATTPNQFAAHIKAETARYSQIIKAAGIKVE
ncbi:MAG: tripartite tricarboxylate transporter substrate binding protein [Betaproteobacteria bacterium]|nr:tripartite tricarboxylate transporter substrate binding protein [Betaproteobacteria bacterium]